MKQKKTRLGSFIDHNSLSFNTSSYSEILLKNCGFPSNFFEQIDQNIKDYKNSVTGKTSNKKGKNSIANAGFSKSNKTLKHDKCLNNTVSNINCSNGPINFVNNISCSNFVDDIEKVGKAKNTENDSKERNNFYIKSYKSKYKIQKKIQYEKNSFDVKIRNKNKIFHKCCYPGCNRTFSTSGWLRTHYNVHLQDIHSSAYCRLFAKYLLNEKLNFLNNIENLYYSNTNIYNSISSNYQNFLFNDRNISMNVNNSLGINQNSFYPFSDFCLGNRSYSC